MNANYNPETKEITIVLPVGEPKLSSKGRSTVIATSHGSKYAGFEIDGHPAYVNANVLCFKDELSPVARPPVSAPVRRATDKVKVHGGSRKPPASVRETRQVA